MKEKIKNFAGKAWEKTKEIFVDHAGEIVVGVSVIASLITVVESLKSLRLYNRNQKLDYEIKMKQLNK